MKTKFLNSENLILETLEDAGIDVKDLKLYRRWAYDVGKMLLTDEQLQRIITVKPVIDGKLVLPDNFMILDEVAAKVGDCGNYSLKAIASQYKQDLDGCEITIDVACNKCKKQTCSCEADEYIINVDRLISLNIPTDIAANNPLATVQGTGGLFDRNVYDKDYYYNKFVLMSPSIDYKEMYKHHTPECINLNLQSDLVYYIQNGVMEVNFKEGDIFLVYLGLPTDDQSNIMVPDIPEAIEAFQEYLLYKHFRRDFLKTNSRESQVKYSEAFQRYERKKWEAKTKAQIPDYQEIAKVFRNSRRNKLISAYTNYMTKGIAKHSLTKYPIHRSR